MKNLSTVHTNEDEALAKKLLCIGAVALLVLMALPFLKFASGNEYATTKTVVNGFQTLFGKNKSILAIVLFLSPLAILASNFVAQLQPYKRTIVIGAPIISIVFEIITFFRVKSAFMNATGSMSDYADFSCKPQIGFFLLLIVYIVIAAIGFLKCPKGEKDRF